MSKMAIIFILTYVCGLFSALFVDAYFGVILYVIEYFVNPKNRWWYGSIPHIRYSFIIAVCIFVGYFLRRYKYNENRLLDLPPVKWLIPLIILMGLVSFIAVWPERHREIYIIYLKQMAFIFFVYKLIDTPKKLEHMIWAFLGGCFYIGTVAYSTGRNAATRLEGIGPMDASDSNGLAAVLVVSIPLLFYYIVEGKEKWQKILSLLFLAFIFNALVLINSRAGFLSLGVSGLYLSYHLFFNKMKGFNFKIKMAAGIVVVVALFVYMTDALFWERMDTLKGIKGASSEQKRTGSDRIYYWIQGIKLSKQYPLGTGGWGYLYLSPNFIHDDYLTGGMRAPHSTWIEVLVDYGYLGLFLFIGFVTSCFRLCARVQKHLIEKKAYDLYYQLIAIKSGYIGFLVVSCFNDRFYVEVMYWLPALIACFANIYYFKGYADQREPVARHS